MTTATLPAVKRGDTYVLTCTYKLGGTPQDLTLYTLRSQMRNYAGVLVEEFTVTKDPDQVTNPGRFLLTPSGDSAAWEVGTHELDIEFTLAGVVESTSTMRQPVLKDITQ